MQWLGLDWDEGPLGRRRLTGPTASSERCDIYADVLARLRESKYTYDCFCTTEEVDARRKASGSKVMGYDGFCRELTDEQVAAFEAEGRKPVVRFRMPDGAITLDDLVRGDITFETEFVPDFALCRANGDPLYTLVDAGRRRPHGDHPRAARRGPALQHPAPGRAVRRADRASASAKFTPRFGHLPYVMGEGNKKLSKRDPQAHMALYRDQGFLPEGLLNYLALLGWAIAADRDIFTLDEMVQAFDIKDVNPNPARFDLKKAEAINASHMRMISLEDMTDRVLPFLQRAGVVSDPVTDDERAAARLGDAAGRRADEQARRGRRHARLPLRRGVRVHPRRGRRREAAHRGRPRASCRRRTTHWRRWTRGRPSRSRPRCRRKLVDEMGLKPRNAFGPVRVAVTGRRVSPPLFESLELLGRERGLARLEGALA